MGAVTPTPDVSAHQPADAARLQVDGREADRELDALAGWLRGSGVLGGGWSVSRVRPEGDSPDNRMGAGDLDSLMVVLQSTLGLAQLIVAVRAWREARAAKGRSDITVTVIYLGNVTMIGNAHEVGCGNPDPAPGPTAEGTDDES